MHDLKKICDEIIHHSFQELLDEDIRVEMYEIENGLAEYGGLEREGFFVGIDSTLHDEDESVVQGAIAHELAHIVINHKKRLRLALYGRLIEWVAYKISKRFRALEERNTDLEVIMRGYGRQLMALMEYSEEKWDYDRDEGLSRREIGAILASGEHLVLSAQKR